MSNKRKNHRVGDSVIVDGRPGAIRSIGYNGGQQLVANIDMDDGSLVTRAVASPTIVATPTEAKS